MLSKAVGDEGAVVAVEPVAHYADICAANIAMNSRSSFMALLGCVNGPNALQVLQAAAGSRFTFSCIRGAIIGKNGVRMLSEVMLRG